MSLSKLVLACSLALGAMTLWVLAPAAIFFHRLEKKDF